MTDITGIEHVQLAAPPGCEDEARRFYGGLLGLPELDKPPVLAARGGAWFACGAQALHVGVEQAFAPAAKAHPGLLAADERVLEALAARLGAAGSPVRWDGDLPGFRRFYTADPWGNRIEVLTPTPS
jgi:catechol 2,3-dioxygenase-like lactoylglutathione lyase family enzyme